MPSQSYLDCRTRGRRLYDQLNVVIANPPAQDFSHQTDIFDTRPSAPYVVVEDIKPAGRTVGAMLAEENIDQGRFRHFDVYASSQLRLDERPPYENSYSTRDGVILCHDNDKNRDTNQPPVKVEASEALFQGWRHCAVADSVPTQTLRSIWRLTVINTITLPVAAEAIRMEYGTSADPTVAYEFTPQSDGFWSLLGTPNGGGILHMLMDHPLTLGRRNVERIKVYPLRGPARHMAFFLSAALPPPPPPKKPGKRSIAGQRRRDKRASKDLGSGSGPQQAPSGAQQGSSASA